MNPPPPPPHGEAPKTTGSGLPPGKYDIFIIPPHSSGSGFLYLPSMRPNTNSFAAGFASALFLVVIGSALRPAVQSWWNSVKTSGGVGILMLICSVAVGFWVLGRTQGGGPGPGGDPGTAGYDAGGHTGSFPGAHAGAPPNAHSHSNGYAGGYPSGAPPPPPPQSGSTPGPTPGSHQRSGPAPEPQYSRPPPEPQYSRPPPEPQYSKPPPEPEYSKPAPEPQYTKPPPEPQYTRPPPEPQRPKPAPEPEKASTPPPPRPSTPPPKPTWQRSTPTSAPPPKPSTPNTSAKSAWEKAREETKKKEEERKTKEAEKKRREDLEKRLKELREKEAREREAREKRKKEEEEKENAKKKADERIKDLADAKARLAERMATLAREKIAAAAKEKAEKEAKELADKKAAEEAASKPPPSTYAFSSVGERLNPWPKGRPVSPTPAPRPRPPPPAPRSHPTPPPPPTSPKKPPPPTAKTHLDPDEDAYSYRPYDKPKKPTHAKSPSSIYSETSYAHSSSTSKTTPPPSRRGPYSTKDPDKIVIKAVYSFNNGFVKVPSSQLVSGVGSVTDGLILRITTEGLFIDDDVRGVPQREWDVKAWTMKLVEVWCPAFRNSVSNSASARTATPKSSNSFRRLWGLDKDKVATSEETDALLVDMLHLCKNNCRVPAPPVAAPRSYATSSVYSASSAASSAFDDRNDSAYGSSVGSSSPRDNLRTNKPGVASQTGELKSARLHILRASIRDQEGKRYVFILTEEESWKVAVGLQRLKKGSQVRALGISGMSANDAKGTLENLGWA